MNQEYINLFLIAFPISHSEIGAEYKKWFWNAYCDKKHKL